MSMEITNYLHRSPLVSQSGVSQQLRAGNSHHDCRRRCPSPAASTQIRHCFWSSRRIYRMRSFQECRNQPELESTLRLRRVCSAGAVNPGDVSDDEDYYKNLEEMAVRCNTGNSTEGSESSSSSSSEIYEISGAKAVAGHDRSSGNLQQQGQAVGVRPFPSVNSDMANFAWPEPEWEERRANPCKLSPVNLEKKAERVGLPLSLRMLKRKQSKERGLMVPLKTGLAGMSETAVCSVKRAFSSMVFMIRELQSYTLQMRQFLSYGDIQELLVTVHKEMHASFVWLFQQVFSCTPALMLSVMILMANFTVYSMGNNVVAVASVQAFENPPAAAASVSVLENDHVSGVLLQDKLQSKFGPSQDDQDASAAASQNQAPKTEDTGGSAQDLLLDAGDGLGGGRSGRGRNFTAAGGFDGDSGIDKSSQNRAMFSEEKTVEQSKVSNPSTGNSQVGNSQATTFQLWRQFLNESAHELQTGDHDIDYEVKRSLVAPIGVQIEPDNYPCFDRTDLYYEQALTADPNNALLLSNYARFLHLVRHDHDRAGEYFRKAVEADKTDGELISHYAHFLWLACGDLEAAEEKFLEAIDVDPENPHHAASYAHFLWNTGGEDTCYPLA